jgi:hypothetical protein
MIDYEKQKEKFKNFPKIHIGQEIQTEIGKGLVVGIDVPFLSGISVNPEKCAITVWYSKECEKWDFYTFSLDTILKFNKFD